MNQLDMRSILTFILTSMICLSMSWKDNVHGIIRRHDRTDQQYINLGKSYPVGQFSSGGSGILVGAKWVLTAAHVFLFSTPNTKTFAINGLTYAIEEFIPHPQGLPSGIFGGTVNLDYDIGLVRLKHPVIGVTPSKVFVGDPSLKSELGKMITIVGYGKTGTGLTGATFPENTKRACTNTIDQIGGNLGMFGPFLDSVMMVDFDNPGASESNLIGSATPLELEGGTATFDSGCGAFIDFGNGIEVAGVFSGVISGTSAGPTNKYGMGYRIIRTSSVRDFINGTLPSATSNQAPIAQAGSDQALMDTNANGSEDVVLNGSASSDADGTIVNYVWTENMGVIATGANPTVTLSVSTHSITLTVTDNDGVSSSGTVSITIVAGN